MTVPDDFPFGPIRTGPDPIMWNPDGSRSDRPRHGQLGRFADRTKVANIVCPRKRPSALVAVVLHRDLVVTADGDSIRADQDFYVSCRCGLMHAVIGVALAREIEVILARRRGKAVPRITVQSVERDTGDAV
jgi:hypothetical protein